MNNLCCNTFILEERIKFIISVPLFLLYLLSSVRSKSLYSSISSWLRFGLKRPPANAGDIRDTGLNPWAWKISWRRASQPTPVFLPGESYGQRNLVGYSPWGQVAKSQTWLKWISTHIHSAYTYEKLFF